MRKRRMRGEDGGGQRRKGAKMLEEVEGERKKNPLRREGGEEDEAAETHFITTLLPLQLHYLHSNTAGSAPAGPLLINSRAGEAGGGRGGGD